MLDGVGIAIEQACSFGGVGGEQGGVAALAQLFLQQLVGARASGNGIDKKVDNVSGATYSVKMMQRMARTALALDALAR